METIKNFLKSRQAKRFYWQTLGGFLGLGVIFLQEPEIAGYWYAPFVIALIQGITKEINNKYQ